MQAFRRQDNFFLSGGRLPQQQAACLLDVAFLVAGDHQIEMNSGVDGLAAEVRQRLTHPGVAACGFQFVAHLDETVPEAQKLKILLITRKGVGLEKQPVEPQHAFPHNSAHFMHSVQFLLMAADHLFQLFPEQSKRIYADPGARQGQQEQESETREQWSG